MSESKYKIHKIETKKAGIPQRAVQKSGILPKFPFSWMLSGRSGSGKSNLLINILTRKELLGGYFQYIIVFSPTAGKYDDLYDSLKLPPENFKAEFGPEQLEEIIDARKALIDKKGIAWVAKNARVLIIMDDVISNRKFLESPVALTMFALLRHYLCSIMVLMQSYTKLPRALRLNCNAVSVFPSSQSEIEVLIQEITPAGINKRRFEHVIDYATAEKYNFLYINYHADKDKQIRKNLDEIINLDEYKN